ncbi:arsenical pump-driving ATPase [Neobacillus sp. PS3-40]|uniref:arsenical pump-driving ATPase n=1 Tax=Neobacillus sp. PS3-40 TaxID=3070679 RepID=UPI0027DFCCB6|nr:arsenical pump-driving ATPase [Neobacillus sp. PS3-40]WML43193.1 arsenical pump-driving ATPase [Neobacillus sp. PS3-40]
MFPFFQPENQILTPFLFFTGKGGVGKTTSASAVAVHLANKGKLVLIVSTDPASNLQDVFETNISNEICPIPNVKGLFACNLDPEEAARAYREKVVGPYKGKLPDSVLQTMEEQLSGACTVEIAAFDEFTNLLTNPMVQNKYDHIIFDTAPTGHTLRLLQLPTAWTDFLNESTHGASCLGPLSGLREKKDAYAKAVEALSDQEKTTLVLVARPDENSLLEAERAACELFDIGMIHRILLVNGVLQCHVEGDDVSEAFYHKQRKALLQLPIGLKDIPVYEIPLVTFSLAGTDALSVLFQDKEMEQQLVSGTEEISLPPFTELVEDLELRGIKVIFTMGKGGVGKTTIASAIAMGLSEKGHQVHLTTTDPAAHLSYYFGVEKSHKNLTISRIDPKVEVEKYRSEVLSKVSENLDEDAIAFIKEDLESPCTEEIAIFQAFANVVGRSKDEIVVIDTAPTGHTLLLLDAAHSYHKELERSTGEISDNVKELLPRLRNQNETEIVIATLPEATPVLEAERLQKDLGRAGIIPHWWVINQSFYATHTLDPVLRGRAQAEENWIQKVQNELSDRIAVIPWLESENVGINQIKQMINSKE